MSYRWYLFDADGTLFDYDRAEAAALAELWSAGSRSGSPPVESYRRINGELWQAYERGEIAQSQIAELRFERLVAELGLATDAASLAHGYLVALSRQTHLVDGARSVLETLAGRARLGVVTNGLPEVQRPRLAASGLAPLFEVVMISGEIGVAKPDPAFFRAALAAMGSPDPRDVLVVGDSLTSDVAGGIAAGLDTAWFEPSGAAAPPGQEPTWTVRRLAEVLEL